jgi:hypothetical protein
MDKESKKRIKERSEEIMKKHFVKFFSPGTIVAETTDKEIKEWDTNEALRMSKDIKERYGARPYGFYFYTKERKENELDSKITKKSGIFYIGGIIKTLEEVKNENLESNRILISNMEINGYDRIIEVNSSYSWTMPFRKDDTLLELK